MSLRYERADGASRGPGPQRWYWPLTVGCLVVGAVAVAALLAEGIPLLFAGLVLVALARVRRRPRVFWPLLVGALVFAATAFVLAPGPCTTTTTEAGQPAAPTTCTSLVGIHYSGVGEPTPAYWLALAVGLPVGALAAGVTRLSLVPSLEGF